ncbi:protein kinase domain-containing protein [Rubritalea sp.]|uniref:protein kinase domain-containing protein n=1 Tax=Rubritalea sp. TaxID=2109375 RepID=UPI003EF78BEB
MSSDQIPQAIPFEAPDVKVISQLLPAYSFDCLLATGGMGAVYKATQTSLDRPVAVKILPPELGSDETFRQGFESEAKLMARLNHPNLIGVYDFGEVDGMLYIVMEFVDGTTLYEHAYQKQLPQLEAVETIIGISNGLYDAHKAGILHRDIKPANIFITKDGTPKIGDFGLARPSGNTESGVIYGTPGYAAPEVVAAPEKVGAATDIFAVGVMLYELLAGKMPAQIYQPLERFGKFDNSLERTIRKAMAADPALRFQSAEELSEKLGEVRRRIKTGQKLAPKATSAVPRAVVSASTARTTVSTKKVKKKSSGPLSFVLIVALSAGIYYAWQAYEAKKADIAVVEKKNSETPDQIHIKEDGSKLEVYFDDSSKNKLIKPLGDLANTTAANKNQTKVNNQLETTGGSISPAPTETTKASHSLSEEDLKKQFITELTAKNPALSELITEKRAVLLDGGIRLVAFINDDITWKEAEQLCKKYGATLAILGNKDDVAKIKTIIPSWGACWIGAYTEGDKNWNWVDGTPWGDSIEIRKTTSIAYAQIDSDIFASAKKDTDTAAFLIEWKKNGTTKTKSANKSSSIEPTATSAS